MLCVMILFSIATGLSTPMMRTGFATKWTKFSHKVITVNILSVNENVVSCSECIMQCLELLACVSVFYRQVSRRCQLHDVLFLSPQDGEKEMGTEYYSLTAGSCPSGYVHARHLGLCYQLHVDYIQYDASLTDCTSRGEHFIVIDSQEKQDHVRKLILASSETQKKGYYIDGSDAATEGQWLYNDGRPMTFFAWREGEPTNETGDMDYVALSRFKRSFQWRNIKKERKYYMCQRDI